MDATQPSTPTGPEADAPTVPKVRRGVVVASLVVTLLSIGVIVAAVVVIAGRHRAETVTYVVPAGTASKLNAGTPVELMPKEVRLEVGDTLVIRNDDVRDAVVGPYLVRAGESVSQTFTRPQTLVGECSFSRSGEIRIVVT